MTRPVAEKIVIKYGGNAISDGQSLSEFARVVVELVRQNKEVVIVHGGGPQINAWLEKTHIKSHFVAGQRYTDPQTLEVVEMVLSAHVNKAIVRALQEQGLSSVGISGEDGYLFKAEPLAELGKVGQIKQVNPSLPLILLEKGYIPVISPLSCSDDGEVLNVNADFAAAHLAGKIGAQTLLLMTNVAGILDAKKERLKMINQEQIAQLTASGVISGGMLPKTECAVTALEKGCHSVVIFDGSKAENLSKWLHEPDAIGTKIIL